tara:strand:- start:89 stop:796 length:708 start_codon:yes stop_codon:yes gene_type:complete
VSIIFWPQILFLDNPTMSDDPFAMGGDDDAFGDDAGDAFGAGDAEPSEDIFGATEEENGGNTDDPFGDAAEDTTNNEPAVYDMVSEEQGGDDMMGNMESNEQKMEIPQPGPTVPEEEDCSALNNWRTQWRTELEAKATEATAEKSKRRQAAEEERRGMTEARTKALEARAESNRQDEMTFLEEREKLAQPGANPWERVVSLVDTQVDDLEKSKATERMRTILIQMKGQKTGPGIP